ncbi:MAG: hypothetical protein RL226_1624 [Bacteroidota bacterium]
MLAAASLLASCKKMELREDISLKLTHYNGEAVDNLPFTIDAAGGQTHEFTFSFSSPAPLAEIRYGVDIEADESEYLVEGPQPGDTEGQITYRFVVDDFLPGPVVGLPLYAVIRVHLLNEEGVSASISQQVKRDL